MTSLEWEGWGRHGGPGQAANGNGVHGAMPATAGDARDAVILVRTPNRH